MNPHTDEDEGLHRFSKDRPRFNDTLDVIKFLCKDLWTLVFRKQVDNLKTNHRVRTRRATHPLPRPQAWSQRMLTDWLAACRVSTS